MEKLHLYLVRHGESQGNATGDYSTLASGALSALGQAQAQHLVQPLSALHFDLIIVSPLQRALQTIAPYLMQTDQRAEVWPELAEVPLREDRVGIAESWTSQPAELPEELPGRYDFREGQAIQPGPNEPLGQGLYRVEVVKRRLLALVEERPMTILMVSHGHFLRELMNSLFANPEIIFYRHENCGMSSIIGQDTWAVDYLNLPTGPRSQP